VVEADNKELEENEESKEDELIIVEKFEWKKEKGEILLDSENKNDSILCCVYICVFSIFFRFKCMFSLYKYSVESL
jgi:hypothetical protein